MPSGRPGLADKVYAGFTSTQTAHGGQETTLLALYNTVIHFGGVLVAPGYTDPVKFEEGNPYGVSNVDSEDGKIERRGAWCPRAPGRPDHEGGRSPQGRGYAA